MTLWTKNELLEALFDQISEENLHDDLIVEEVLIDSRKITKNGLFVAIKGDNNDGHDFLEQAFQNGCTVALVQDKAQITKIKNSQFLLVKDTFQALYKLAEFSRHRSHAKIIAVTGSVGKTGTKEMLRSAFAAYGKTFATTGNLNNHFGLPLSLCNFAADCHYGIFEMGMNHLGEIRPLSLLAKPHIAIITNVGPVHIENFKNEEEIALAKSEIFAGLLKDGKALINHDNVHFELLNNLARSSGIDTHDIISFGETKGSNYQLLSQRITDADHSEVQMKLKNDSAISYKISTSQSATIANSTIVVACLDLVGKNLDLGLESFKSMQTPAGRGKISEIKIDNKHITIIDDSYNASVLSMKAGLIYAENLKKVLKKKRVVAALGDMLELGEKSLELHVVVTKFLQEFHADFAVLVGEKMTQAAQSLPKNFYKAFPDSALAGLEIKGLLHDGDILYVKGSRGTKMEKVIEGISKN